VLGFKLREAARTPEGDIGVWMSVTSQVHDLAIMRDGQGRDGRLHHTAYYLDTPEGILRAADIFVDEGTPIDTGPGKHGLTQAFFIYVFEPGATGWSCSQAATSSTARIRPIPSVREGQFPDTHLRPQAAGLAGQGQGESPFGKDRARPRRAVEALAKWHRENGSEGRAQRIAPPAERR
jgi:hypothetical protein